MKKIVGILLIVIGLFVSSCEEPKPDCEIYGYGTVEVVNSTGYNIWVDITWGNISENYEKLLYSGNSYTYREVPAGSIECWASLDGYVWHYEYESLSSCENLTYTWYMSGKKSTNSGLYLVMSVDGVIVDTIYNFKILEK